MYWKSWELAFKNFHEPASGSGYVSQFIDAAFNENIFLWDTCFITMFCNCAHPLVPGIASLDNLYAKQHLRRDRLVRGGPAGQGIDQRASPQ